ncbi:MAG TPA: hypothetical protein ACQGQH_02020 [Xylella sp.]
MQQVGVLVIVVLASVLWSTGVACCHVDFPGWMSTSPIPSVVLVVLQALESDPAHGLFPAGVELSAHSG